jgi:hypothetical protein
MTPWLAEILSPALGTETVYEAEEGHSEGRKKPSQNIECRFHGKVVADDPLRIRIVALAL